MIPVVSVVIPTYNRADLVVRAVESALAQTYSNLEVIVADDGSTDATQDMMKAYNTNRRVKYIHIPHSGLPAVARNAGLREAQGEYIAFLDSDDAWMPEKLEKQMSVLLSDPQVGLVCTNALVERGENSSPYLKDGDGQSGYVFQSLLKENFIINSSVLTRRSVLQAEHGFCEDPVLRAMEDYHLWLRINLKHKTVYINELLTVYNDVPSESLRSEQKMLTYWQGMLRIYTEFKHAHMDDDSANILQIQRKSALRNYLKELFAQRQYFKWALVQAEFFIEKYFG